MLILVGQRAGIPVYGCNIPGHFLAMAPDPKSGEILIDCYNGGYILLEREIQKLFSRPTAPPRHEVIKQADADTILMRYLQNLLYSYDLKKEYEEKDFITQLHQTFQAESANRN